MSHIFTDDGKQWKLIPLTKGYVAIVDADDFDRVNEFKWCAISKGDKYVYASRGASGVNFTYMHRFILGLSNRRIKVDHIDGNGLNNSKSNLRICTQGQNVMNRRKLKPLSSKYKGVSFKKKGYEAQIQFDQKSIYLGRFQNESDAARAYNNKAKELFGEFARLNEIYP